MKAKKLLGVLLSIAMVSSTFVASMTTASAASVDPTTIEYTTVNVDLSQGSSYNYYNFGDSTNTTKTYDNGILTISTNESQAKFLPYINKYMEAGHNWYYVTYTFKSNVHPNQTIDGQFGRVYYSNESSSALINGKAAAEGYANCPSLFQHWLGPEYKTFENIYNTDNWTTITYYVNAGEYSKTGNMQIYSYINGVYKSMVETTAVKDWEKMGDIKFQTSQNMTASWSFKDIKAGYGDGTWAENLGFLNGKQINLTPGSGEYDFYTWDNAGTTRVCEDGVLTVGTNNSMVKFMTYNRSGKEYIPTGYKYYYAGYTFKSNQVAEVSTFEPFMSIYGLDADSCGDKKIAQTALRGVDIGGANGLAQFYASGNFEGWDHYEGTYSDYRVWNTIAGWTTVEYYGVRNDDGTSKLYLFINGQQVADKTYNYDIERLGSFKAQSNKNQTGSFSVKDVRFAYGNDMPNAIVPPAPLDKPEYTGYTELEVVKPISLESHLYPNDQFTYKYDEGSQTLAVVRPASSNSTNFQMLGEQKFNGKTYTNYDWYKVSYDVKLESGDMNNFGHFGWVQYYNTEGITTGVVMNTNYANASSVDIRAKNYSAWNQKFTVDHSTWNHYEFWYHRTNGNMEAYFAVNGEMYGPYDTLIASSDFNALGQLMFGYDHNAGDPVETTLRLANVNYSYGQKPDFEVPATYSLVDYGEVKKDEARVGMFYQVKVSEVADSLTLGVADNDFTITGLGSFDVATALTYAILGSKGASLPITTDISVTSGEITYEKE